MLKQQLERRIGTISNAEFAVICEIVTDDIKFNHIHFKKKTTKGDILDIAERSVLTLRRCV